MYIILSVRNMSLEAHISLEEACQIVLRLYPPKFVLVCIFGFVFYPIGCHISHFAVSILTRAKFSLEQLDASFSAFPRYSLAQQFCKICELPLQVVNGIFLVSKFNFLSDTRNLCCNLVSDLLLLLCS